MHCGQLARDPTAYRYRLVPDLTLTCACVTVTSTFALCRRHERTRAARTPAQPGPKNWYRVSLLVIARLSLLA